MPIDDYYSGNGAKVLKAMKDTYGSKQAKKVFYATAKKQAKKSGPRKTA